MNDRVHDEIQLRLKLAEAGVLSNPADIKKLLRAMAGSEQAKQNRSETILVAAAEMIEAFEQIALEKI